MLVIWSTNNHESIECVDMLEQLCLNKADDWGTRVRFCALSYNEEPNHIIKKIHQKQWGQLDFYAGDQSLKQAIGFQEVPHLVLVDKWANVVRCQHPMSSNL